MAFAINLQFYSKTTDASKYYTIGSRQVVSEDGVSEDRNK